MTRWRDTKYMTTAKWMLYAKKADFNGIGTHFHISPVIARIIRNRDVCGDENIEKYLRGTWKDLYSPHRLKDADLAAGLLLEKIRQGKRIRIVGDYDIDGVCSTYLLYKGLKRLGAAVDYEIPDRIKDGYGINIQIVEAAAEDNIDTILTCDNGISAIDQMKCARELGMTVIVTDHHDIVKVGEEDVLPEADAIVNPKQSADTYPWKEICGGMVAYKLIQVLFEEYGIDRQEWLDMLELAAIATVGDVMKLKDENRIVVKEGLKKLANTKIQGLVSLMEKNTLDPEHISAYHVGFVLGPCLNASGRLKTAQMAMELLLAENKAQADELADALKALNDERKDMTKDGTDAAIEQVETELKDDKVLVVFLPDCHESLAGIVAGRIREYYNKPVFVLTRAEGCAKGSGRSIEAYHMFHALVEVKDLLLKFGGHPMAAGFSLEEANIEEFRRRLNENAAKRLTEDDFIPRVWIDVPMPFEYITESLIRELELLEPFGQGNEKPQFALKSLKIRSARVFGRNRNVVKLSLMNERGFSMDGVVFTEGDLFMEEMGNSQSMDIIYYPTINEYNGNRSLQLVVKDWKFH